MTLKILKPNLQIAIDGPVGSGKSVGAYKLAKKLNVLYVYTGAMYRATAFIGLQHGLDLSQEDPLVSLLKQSRIELKKSSSLRRVCDVFINGQDETEELFSSRLHWGSSQVGIFPRVRKHLVKLQQEIARHQPVVMEGRDITTVVLPKADLKIYMTASLRVRALRRLKDLLKRGEKATLPQVIKEVKKRDYQDIHRQVDPLKITPDAWVLDTSKISINQEVDMIISRLKQLGLVSVK